MKILSDSDYLKALESAGNYAAETTKQAMQENHDWEIRRLKAQIDDAERDRNRYRAGYKNALRKVKVLRSELAEASRRLLESGLGSTPAKDDEGKDRKLGNTQAIMDAVVSEIPGMDDGAQGAVRLYVERELRKRGIEQAEEILAEATVGGFVDDD